MEIDLIVLLPDNKRKITRYDVNYLSQVNQLERDIRDIESLNPDQGVFICYREPQLMGKHHRPSHDGAKELYCAWCDHHREYDVNEGGAICKICKMGSLLIPMGEASRKAVLLLRKMKRGDS